MAWIEHIKSSWTQSNHIGRTVTDASFVRNGVDLFEKCHTVGMTIRKSMTFWDNCSVLRDGQSRRELNDNNLTLEGAHLFRAGGNKWLHLRELPANIFPIDSYSHISWDTYFPVSKAIRPVHEKIQMLLKHCTYHHTVLISEIVKRLSEMAER